MDVDVATRPAFRSAVEAAAAREPGPEWLAALRRAALERLLRDGLPTPADEDWRYTDLGPSADLAAGRLATPAAAAPLPAEIRARLASGCTRIVLVDGVVAPALTPAAAPAGVTITTLGEIPAARRPDLLARLAAEGPSTLTALNTALLRQAIVIEVAPGTSVAEPIGLACVSTADGMAQNRVLLSLGAGSEATVVEHHLGTGAGLSNSVTDVVCDPGATVRYVKLQDESAQATHLAAQRFVLGAGARAELLHLDLGARLARNDLAVELAGEGSEVSAHGLFMADGKRHLDNHTRIDHRGARSLSRELYRGVADGGGRGIFNGKVIVHPGAIGADARLNSQNLLLAAGAEIDTKPELEIYADDVRCSHGATTGQLDAAAIFYLRSRGIPAEQARRILIASFVREIVQRVPGGILDQRLAALAAERLPELADVAGAP